MNYSVKINDRFYHVAIKDLQSNPIIASVDGEDIEVWLDSRNSKIINPNHHIKQIHDNSPSESFKENDATISTEQMANGAKIVIAPIPGVVLSIFVKPGEKVLVGQELCIIEAMKMRNVIRSSWTGQIEEVYISTVQTVNHNEKMIKFSE